VLLITSIKGSYLPSIDLAKVCIWRRCIL